MIPKRNSSIKYTRHTSKQKILMATDMIKTCRFSVFDLRLPNPNEIQNHEVKFCPFQIFSQIFDEDACWDAAAASHQEIKLMGTRSVTLTYGEIEYESFAEILNCLTAGAISDIPHSFVDLGSGTGKALFASALHCKFHHCFGIEILSSLHQLSLQHLETWNHLSEIHHSQSRIKFFEGSFFDLVLFDWTVNMAVVFANSTCYSLEMIAQLSTIAGINRTSLSAPQDCRSHEIRILLHLFNSPTSPFLWI
jgi:hypothetical protein